MIVQPGRFVAGDACRQDLRLPCTGRRLEALQQRDRGGNRVRPFQPRRVGHALPGEQEAQEVACGDRLDLGAQAADRVVMDAGEQPPIAPFLGVAAGREAATQRKALDFQRGQRCADVVRLQSQRRGQRGLGHRSQTLQPAAQDVGQLHRCRADSDWNCCARSAATHSVACGAVSRGHTIRRAPALPASRAIPARPALRPRSGSRATAARRAVPRR